MLLQRATGAAAIDVSIVPGRAWQLEQVRLHLDAVGGAAENLTMTVDAIGGAEYDAVILTQAMAAVSDLIYVPERPIKFAAGDELDIAYANGNARTYGLEVFWTLI